MIIPHDTDEFFVTLVDCACGACSNARVIRTLELEIRKVWAAVEQVKGEIAKSEREACIEIVEKMRAVAQDAVETITARIRARGEAVEQPRLTWGNIELLDHAEGITVTPARQSPADLDDPSLTMIYLSRNDLRRIVLSAMAHEREQCARIADDQDECARVARLIRSRKSG